MTVSAPKKNAYFWLDFFASWHEGKARQFSLDKQAIHRRQLIAPRGRDQIWNRKTSGPANQLFIARGSAIDGALNFPI
jgi:hypothetical protein